MKDLSIRHVVAHLVVGYVLALIYAPLAGGADLGQTIGLTVVAPFGALILWNAWKLYSRNSATLPEAACWTALVFLPVMLNHISEQLGALGHETVSEFLFTVRYAAVILVVAALYFVLRFWGEYFFVLQRLSWRIRQRAGYYGISE